MRLATGIGGARSCVEACHSEGVDVYDTQVLFALIVFCLLSLRWLSEVFVYSLSSPPLVVVVVKCVQRLSRERC